MSSDWPTCTVNSCCHVLTHPDEMALRGAVTDHREWVSANGYAVCVCCGDRAAEFEVVAFPCDNSRGDAA